MPRRHNSLNARGRVGAVAAGALRQPSGIIGASFLLLVVVCSACASLLAPYSPEATDFSAVLSGPTASHWLGTDALGRDTLSRLMYAGGPSLWHVLIATVVCLLAAVPMALLSGLKGGWIDAIASRIADVVLSVPGIVVVLMVLTLFSQNMVAAMVTFGLLHAPGLFRVVRSAALAVSNEPYIQAARVAGLHETRIALRHIYPRTFGPMIVNLSLVSASALLAETGLNFLKLGVRPPTPSLGGMVAESGTVLQQHPWFLTVTGSVVALTVISLVLVGDALRDADVASRGANQQRKNRARRTTSPSSKADARQPSLTIPLAMTESVPLLEVIGLTLTFPHPHVPDERVSVVEDVSFRIERSETLGIVGESGCGKSLTALALLGLLPDSAEVDAGAIRIHGQDAIRMSKADRSKLRGKQIAYVSQEPMSALDPLFTVGHQLREAVRTHTGCDKSQARTRAVALLRQVQIADAPRVAGLYPHEISGGMAQRVCIALALAGAPELLIADEPTTALDVTVQAEIIRLLRDIQEQTGMAILVISHDWAVVRDLSHRCIVMYAGQVVESAPTTRLLSSPRHPYTEGLLGADPKVAAPGADLASIAGTVPPPTEWSHEACRFAPRCPHAAPVCITGSIELTRSKQGAVRCVRSVNGHASAALTEELNGRGLTQ